MTKRAVSILIEEAAKMPVAPIKKIDADNIYEQYHVSDAMWQKTAYQERHSFLNEEKTGLKVKLDPTTL